MRSLMSFTTGDVLAPRVRPGPGEPGRHRPGPRNNNAVACVSITRSASQDSLTRRLARTRKRTCFHSDGNACNNAPSSGVTTRFLDGNAPVAASAKCKDSGSINFAKGNPFSEIGTWSLAPRP